MKILFKTLFVASIVCSITVNAQKSNGITVHTIKSGETLSAIAAKYGTNVGDIMRLNGMNAKSLLSIGEKIKIPTKKTDNKVIVKNTAPEKNTTVPSTVENANPKTHTVQQGETLYKLSKQYNISIAQLQQWNNMSDLNVKIGQVLFLSPNNSGLESQKATVETTKPVVKNETVVTPTTEVKSATVETVKEVPLIKEKEVVVVNPEKDVIAESAKNAQTEGFFANYYDFKAKNKNTLTGEASILKTVSGWTDKKYYVLMNDIAQGTIVRITANNKSICAKVLGGLPDIKEDVGLLLRLSNAAVAELGIEEAKFTVLVNY
ncbi:MAG: LysM peptidoglycan-binding domain-containing protein [Chitinophagaceae bacterium]